MRTVTFYLADQHPGRDRSLGITGYSLRLLEELQKTNSVVCRALISTSSVRVTGATQVLPFRTDHVVARVLGDHFHTPWMGGEGIRHYPKGYLPMMPKKTPAVATIHDTIIQHYVDKYPRERSSLAYAYWMAMTKNSLKRADLIITVSHASRDAILEFCANHTISPPRIQVTYEGASGEEFAGTVAEKKNYLMAFASAQPHKKILQLLKDWRIFEETVRDAPRLLLLGKLDHRLQKQAALCKSVDWTQAPSSHDLSKLISSARGLIFPSEIEGFGLPGVEAYYHGTPVVYAQNTAVEEILRHPVAGGFQLDNFESFRAAVLGVLKMSPAVISKHALFLRDRYSWNKVAERTLEAYASL